MKYKYNWSEKQFNDIEWTIHNRRIQKSGRHSSTVKLKFIHHFLPSGKMNFDIPHQCKHCKNIEDNTTPHNHFLQCYKFTSIKNDKISLISNILQNTYTHPSITVIIVRGLTSFYDGHDTIDTVSFYNNDLVIA